KLKQKANQHSSDMSLVRHQRKGWTRLKDHRLVAKLKVRLPGSGRQVVIDPSKYQENYTKLVLPDRPVSVADLNYVNDDLQDLSRDALRQTSESQRKMAGIWTDEEIAMAVQHRQQAFANARREREEQLQSGLSKTQYRAMLDEKRRQQEEQDAVKRIALQLEPTGTPGGSVGTVKLSNGVVEFLSDEEPDAKEIKLGLFDSDAESDDALPLAPSTVSISALQAKLSLFDDDD
ncbi:hypothetical protein HDU91_000179, partial [Kappamyces sp. JEL0680]